MQKIQIRGFSKFGGLVILLKVIIFQEVMDNMDIYIICRLTHFLSVLLNMGWIGFLSTFALSVFDQSISDLTRLFVTPTPRHGQESDPTPLLFLASPFLQVST